MPIDRRIISILYYNGIEEIDKVEKIIGMNGDYFDVVINGEVIKLKLPEKDYDENSENDIELDEIIVDIDDDELDDEPIDDIQKQREEFLELNDIDDFDNNEMIDVIVDIEEEIVEEIIEEEIVEEIIEEEIVEEIIEEEIVEEIIEEEIIIETTTTTKKEVKKIKETKKIQKPKKKDDTENFMDII